ncbi:MAG: hypothetical protein QXP04_03780 [Candidatus Nanoarchaeia archaeon]|nr:hypothetical protein [Candidatus Jingweiarchaeum tengchongense]
MSEPFTRIVGKEYSPLTGRRYNLAGFPIFVFIITDDDISDMDEVVTEHIRRWIEGIEGLNNFRNVRNMIGSLVDEIRKRYSKSEGIAVVAFPDKAVVSSLWGDFMNHLHCRMELYMLLNTMMLL